MKTILKCGKLFTAENDTVQQDMAIVVQEGEISQIASAEQVDCTGAHVIDLSDKFVMPGLIDSHLHTYIGGYDKGFLPIALDNHCLTVLKCLSRAMADLRAGFTTICDCGCADFGADLSLKQAIETGLVDGPRMLVSGPMIATTSFYFPNCDMVTRTVDGPLEAQKAARDVIAKGADIVKLMATEGVCSPGPLGLPIMEYDEIQAACNVANSLHHISRAHAHGAEGIKRVVKAGITLVDHAMLIDDEGIDLMAEHGTYLCPTFTAGYRMIERGAGTDLPQYMVEKSKYALEQHAGHFQEFLKRGIPIVFGTDTGTPFSAHGEQGVEFRLMVQFGMSPVRALLSATRTAAEFLRIQDKVGTLAESKCADVVAFDKNPLEDISVMEHCSFVMKGGKIYKQTCAESACCQ